MSQHELSADTYKRAFELLRIGNRAVKRAQESNRKQGIPNVYSYNGVLYYELPNGELTTKDPKPAKDGKKNTASIPQTEKHSKHPPDGEGMTTRKN